MCFVAVVINISVSKILFKMNWFHVDGIYFSIYRKGSTSTICKKCAQNVKSYGKVRGICGSL